MENKISPRAIVVIAIGILAAVVLIWQAATRNTDTLPNGVIDGTGSDPTLEARALTGIIMKIGTDSLTIDIPSIFGAAVPENSPLRTREVRVTAETVLDASFEKSYAVYQEERRLYEERKARGERVVPPHPQAEASILFSDLKVGDTVRIIGQNQENIRDVANIVASHITKE